jgi:hypothetical protein
MRFGGVATLRMRPTLLTIVSGSTISLTALALAATVNLGERCETKGLLILSLLD